MTVLDARVAVARGDLALDAALSVDPGETVALLGPNGAGKTTFLRAIAGLEPLDAGCVELGGEIVDDVDGGVHVPAEARSIGVVFQDALLFPHLDAAENVAFGLRCRGVSRTEARARAVEWLERVGVAARARARPRELSGGEAQRVALARALVIEPQLLLLDEPLAALDASARIETRRVLREHLESFEGGRILVTHDPIDAAALSDRVVVLERGSVVQTGTAADIRERPRSRYVADLAGVNLVRGTARSGRVTTDAGFELVVTGDASGAVLAVIHPRAVALHRGPPTGTARNVWRATIAGIDDEGDVARVRLSGGLPIVAEVTAEAVATLPLVAGGEVWAAVKATEIGVYPD